MSLALQYVVTVAKSLCEHYTRLRNAAAAATSSKPEPVVPAPAPAPQVAVPLATSASNDSASVAAPERRSSSPLLSSQLPTVLSPRNSNRGIPIDLARVATMEPTAIGVPVLSTPKMQQDSGRRGSGVFGPVSAGSPTHAMAGPVKSVVASDNGSPPRPARVGSGGVADAAALERQGSAGRARAARVGSGGIVRPTSGAGIPGMLQ